MMKNSYESVLLTFFNADYIIIIIEGWCNVMIIWMLKGYFYILGSVLEYSRSDTPRSEQDDASLIDEVILVSYAVLMKL